VLEEDIINLFYAPSDGPSPEESRGRPLDGLDDCALLENPVSPESPYLLLTTDSLSEGTHFRRDWSGPEDLAIKLFQANLSDLIAGGGQPDFCLLNLGLPAEFASDFPPRFARALGKELEAHACRLIGGDTFRAADLQLSLTLGGRASRRLGRGGGRAGDSLYLTGAVGLALAGYRALQGELTLPETPLTPADPGIFSGYEPGELSLKQRALERHLRPRARAAWGPLISKREEVRALMDVSDGLITDARRLALASRVCLEIELDSVPLIPELSEFLTLEEALESGEEYELLFLASPGLSFPFPCANIGRALPEEPGLVFARNGTPVDLKRSPYRHFRQ